MSIVANLLAQLTVNETITQASASGPGSSIVHDQFNVERRLDANSAPVGSLVAAFTATLSSGALTIDLTALTGTNGATVDMTGDEVMAVLVKNNGANDLEIDVGATNGYNLGGNAAQEIHVPPGGVVLLDCNDVGPTVGASAKDLDLVGTGSQTSSWVIVSGTPA